MDELCPEIRSRIPGPLRISPFSDPAREKPLHTTQGRTASGIVRALSQFVKREKARAKRTEMIALLFDIPPKITEVAF
jgi:hypothetical protein